MAATFRDDVLGVDFGAGQLKMALVRKFDLGEVSVVNFDSITLEPGVIRDGVIEDEDALVAALKELKGMHDWGTTNVNFSFVDSQTEFKTLELATSEDMTEVEMNLTVKTAKDDEFRHLTSSDYIFDYVELTRDARRVKVQLVGESAARTTPYAKALRKAGFKALACEPNSIAGARSNTMHRSRSGVRALLDFGADQTVFTCRQGSEVLYTRFIDIGSNRINDAVMEAIDCSWEEAEALKQHLGFQLPPASDPLVANQLSHYLEAVTMVFDSLVGRLEAVQRDAERELGAVEGLTLVGGGARLKGLEDKIKHYLVLPIEEVVPRVGFETATDFDIFGVALGLSAGPEMTLLPAQKTSVKGSSMYSKIDEKRNQRLAGQFGKKRPTINPLVIGALIGVILVAVMWFMANQDKSKAATLVAPAAPLTTTPVAGYAGADPVTNRVWTLLQEKQAFSFMNALNTLVLGIDNWKVTIGQGSVSFSGEVKDKTSYDQLVTRLIDGFTRRSVSGGIVGRDGQVPFDIIYTPNAQASSATAGSPATTTSTTTPGVTP